MEDYFLEPAPNPVSPPMPCGQALEAYAGSTLPLLHQWHRRLGHPSFGILEKKIPSLVKHCTRSKFFCEACELAKHKRSFYAPVNQRSDSPFMVIHSDVWGPSPVTSLLGYRWFVTFIDCHSRVTWVYLLKAKNEVFSCFQSFHKMVCTQFDANIKVLRSDNGTEYIDGNFRAYLNDSGILFQTSCVGTPQQNGVAERKNRTLTEMVNAMLSNSGLGTGLWGEAILTAAYILNRVPLKKSQITPYELWKKKKPNLSYFGPVRLRVLGVFWHYSSFDYIITFFTFLSTSLHLLHLLTSSKLN